MAGGQRRLNAGLVLGVLALVVSAVSQCTGGTLVLNRVDLKVLVLNTGNVTDAAGNASNERAIISQLQTEGIPYREISLNDPNRPTIDAAFLSTSAGTNPVVNRSYYQAIVIPTTDPTNMYLPPVKQLSPAEFQAVKDWEVKFGIREVVAATNPSTLVGMVDSVTAVDPTGQSATVTAAGLSGPFSYLKGTIPAFDIGSYAYPGAPGPTFTPLVNLASGTIVGTNSVAGREQLVITTTYAFSQSQFKAISHGIVTWMTKGVHLGYDRSYFTMHSDDAFSDNTRWNTTLNCTPGNDCPDGTPDGAPIRMTAADVNNLVAWQNANGLPIVQAFNGYYANNPVYTVNGHDELTDAYVANRNSLQWLNHTYKHTFLGCVQNYLTIPWSCVKDGNGNIQYVQQADIEAEISQNITLGDSLGLPFNHSELLTGEHSGLYILPQQPVDNPALAPALTAQHITTTGADASRQNDPRTVGTARTVPRHPINVFFNTATKAEVVDEYNWIFTSTTDGGSGLCTANGYQCVAPVTDFDSQIVPANTRQALRYVLSNDPRPTYAHVSNLTEDRVLLTQLESILNGYRAVYSTNAPLISQTQTQASATLDAQYAWSTALANNQVEAYTIGDTVYVSTSGGYTGQVPLTAPAGTKKGTLPFGPAFGESYGGEQSAWITVAASPNQSYFLLPSA